MQPQIADFNHNDFNETGFNEEADSQLLVKFYTKSVQDHAKSAAEGRPVFREKEYVSIKTPGNRNDGVARPATDMDKQRFRKHYEAFKQRVELPEEGTPLCEWPQIARSQADELAFYNIKTVEQLAGVSDANGQNFMGFNKLRDKARAFLDSAKENAGVEILQKELAHRDEQITKLQAQVEQLLAASKPSTTKVAEPTETTVSESAEPPKPRRRRPPPRAKKE